MAFGTAFACSIGIGIGIGRKAALPLTAVMTLAASPASASEPASDTLIGKWRFAPEASCGIDDVRAGNLLTVTAAEIRYHALLCLRDGISDAIAGEQISIAGLCNVGGDTPLPITFHWRFTTDAPTQLTVQGYERPVYRCSETTK